MRDYIENQWYYSEDGTDHNVLMYVDSMIRATRVVADGEDQSTPIAGHAAVAAAAALLVYALKKGKDVVLPAALEDEEV